jgi:hypothetical protein
MTILDVDDQYVLNNCAKFLARTNTDARHNFGQYGPGDPCAKICEAWRFPVIDSYRSVVLGEESYAFNRVTFIYQVNPNARPQSVGVVGTFATLFEVIPLRSIAFGSDETDYMAVSVRVPKGRVFRYRFIVDGSSVLDPINPQQVMTANGELWSRFFTHLCTQPLTFEPWEFVILERLVDHVMPFRTDEGQNFLSRFYDQLSQQDKTNQYAFAYRIDQSIGIVNFIDNLLAREEQHHVVDYRICLSMIGRILRQRAPGIGPDQVPKEIYIGLYSEMASDFVTDWDYQVYASPQYFLQMLRRHAYTGAFSHPKYGGNVAALGWRYLADRYHDEKGTLFDWQSALESPLGSNRDYLG